ncbi:hypothetical protein ACNF49_13055 [Actinomadura sp. ATCC 39365]
MPERGSLVDRHVGFVHALREAGLPVSLAEGLDAARALRVIDLSERESLRAAYAATLVKKPAYRPGFDVLFDLWFPSSTTGMYAPAPPRPGSIRARPRWTSCASAWRSCSPAARTPSCGSSPRPWSSGSAASRPPGRAARTGSPTASCAPCPPRR